VPEDRRRRAVQLGDRRRRVAQREGRRRRVAQLGGRRRRAAHVERRAEGGPRKWRAAEAGRAAPRGRGPAAPERGPTGSPAAPRPAVWRCSPPAGGILPGVGARAQRSATRRTAHRPRGPPRDGPASAPDSVGVRIYRRGRPARAPPPASARPPERRRAPWRSRRRPVRSAPCRPDRATFPGRGNRGSAAGYRAHRRRTGP
jgi:hypothetical protein